MAEMTAQEAAEWGKTLSFETVWATLQEVGRKQAAVAEQLEKSSKAFDRNMAEITKKQAEAAAEVAAQAKITDQKIAAAVAAAAEAAAQAKITDQKIAETSKNLDKLEKMVNRMYKNVGGLNESMGSLIETLIAPHLEEKFDAYNYNLKRIFKRVPIYDDTSRQRGEIDILLSDTTVCMAVEVKRWMDSTEKVDRHIKRMELVRSYPPAEIKGKKLLGAIAAAVVHPDVREYAEQNGFFVLELTGEDVRLLEQPHDFQPKEWQEK